MIVFLRNLFEQSLSSDANVAPRLKNLTPGCLMVLPQSFGNIYLGETFSSYVCVHNDSTEICSTVSVRYTVIINIINNVLIINIIVQGRSADSHTTYQPGARRGHGHNCS